jgi:hypothetical protein
MLYEMLRWRAKQQMMEELVVTDKRIDENVVSLQMSKNTLDMNRVRKLPALFGRG